MNPIRSAFRWLFRPPATPRAVEPRHARRAIARERGAPARGRSGRTTIASGGEAGAKGLHDVTPGTPGSRY